MGVSYFLRPTSHDSKPEMRPAKCGPGGVGMEVNGPVVGRVYSLGEVLHWRRFVGPGPGDVEGVDVLLADLWFLPAFDSIVAAV